MRAPRGLAGVVAVDTLAGGIPVNGVAIRIVALHRDIRHVLEYFPKTPLAGGERRCGSSQGTQRQGLQHGENQQGEQQAQYQRGQRRPRQRVQRTGNDNASHLTVRVVQWISPPDDGRGRRVAGPGKQFAAAVEHFDLLIAQWNRLARDDSGEAILGIHPRCGVGGDRVDQRRCLDPGLEVEGVGEVPIADQRIYGRQGQRDERRHRERKTPHARCQKLIDLRHGVLLRAGNARCLPESCGRRASRRRR
jgi:hypothetical protein